MNHYASQMEDVDFVSASIDLGFVMAFTFIKDVFKLAKHLLLKLCDAILAVIDEALFWLQGRLRAIFSR